jgi:hypothetical protein
MKLQGFDILQQWSAIALDVLAGMLARDWNRIIWKEGCYNPASTMMGTYAKSKQLSKDNGLDLSVGYNAVISTLRLDDLLGACAAATGGFRGLPTAMTMPRNDDRGVVNAKLRIMILTDLAVHGLDVPNVSHVINFDLQIDSEGRYNAYVHRGGHAGWLGRRGKAMLLVTSNQEIVLVLEQFANKLLLNLKCVAR